MFVHDKSDHIKDNCTLCKYFTSYCDAYFDKKEPEDQGFCSQDKYETYGDCTLTCELFKK